MADLVAGREPAFDVSAFDLRRFGAAKIHILMELFMKKWSGVFPATTTQFGRDESLDLSATQKVVAALIDDGVNGIICMGTVGENCSLSPPEKRTS